MRPDASLNDWLAYISAVHPTTIEMGLDRVRAVYERMQLVAPAPAQLSLPQQSSSRGAGAYFVTITVGGTNGKGSTCAMLERILIDAGYRVGSYSSPHLIRYNERVKVDGEEADDKTLAASFARVEAARGDTPLTYFEFGTLSALAVFHEARIDAAVLEVGLGGRLDAVNIIDADCAIVASIGIDHVSYLGDTREKIAFEKAGIFRGGRPAICGDPDPPKTLVDHAHSIGADLQVLGRDFRFENHGMQWDFIGRRGARRALPMPALRGSWQLRNAASVLAALDEVAERLPVSIGEVKRGLTLVTLPGRLQVLPGQPEIVLDVAHNPQAAGMLASGLGDMRFCENTFAVFAILGDKDADGVIDAIRGRIDRWFVATPPSERAKPAAEVAALLARRGLEAVTRTFANVESALAAARREAGSNDRIVVFGSFYTVAEALRFAR